MFLVISMLVVVAGERPRLSSARSKTIGWEGTAVAHSSVAVSVDLLHLHEIAAWAKC